MVNLGPRRHHNVSHAHALRVRARRVSVWWLALTVIAASLISNGADVLHFALVSHRWCALHEQIEHTRHLVPSACAPAQAARRVTSSVSVTDPDEATHGRDAGCAIVAAQHQRAVSQLANTVAGPHVTATSRAACAASDVVPATSCLSLAPKRSPPIARV